MGFPIKESLISYFSACEQVFVFAGRDPVPAETTIPNEDIDFQSRLIIKCRPNCAVSPTIQNKKKAIVNCEDDEKVKRDPLDEVKELKPVSMTESQTERALSTATRTSQR